MSKKSLTTLIIVLAVVGISGWYFYSNPAKVPSDITTNEIIPDPIAVVQKTDDSVVPTVPVSTSETPSPTTPESFPSAGFPPYGESALSADNHL